jgi:hypothetical protein
MLLGSSNSNGRNELIQNMVKKYVFSFICISVLVVFMVSSGCTSNPNTQGPSQTIPPTVATTTQIPVPTTSSAPIPPTLVPTTLSTVISATAPANEGLSVTVNSIEKKSTLGGGSPKPGNAILVLDVTIQNNDNNKEFVFSDSSFRILDTTNNGQWRVANTSQFSRGLNSPLVPGSIPANSKKTGQIAFVVLDSSNSYKFSIVDSAKTVITTTNDLKLP